MGPINKQDGLSILIHKYFFVYMSLHDGTDMEFIVSIFKSHLIYLPSETLAEEDKKLSQLRAIH